MDPSTGTLTARAIFTNTDHALLPGMFARVRAPTGMQENALLVPDVVLGADHSGRSLLVVGKDDVVEQRCHHQAAGRKAAGAREGHRRERRGLW
jgi:multidrug efflux pump subunit AcrA (membrane-fusion protein)